MSLKKSVATSLAAIVVGLGIAVIPGQAASAADVLCTNGGIAEATINEAEIMMPVTKTNSTSCSLYYGDDMSGVEWLQVAMNECYGSAVIGSYYPLDTDGDFGPNTRAALRLVQAKIHATVDGSYGPETKVKMKWPVPLDTGCLYWSNDYYN